MSWFYSQTYHVPGITYKGPVPRSADDARFARARKNATKTCKGAERRGPRFRATRKFICQELLVQSY